MSMQQEAMRELARRELARRQQAQASEPVINNERAEGISFADRAIVKNFSQSPEVSAQYLRQQNPDKDIQVHNGQLLVKDKGATEYNVVDPEGFDLEDITDVAYDVGSGIAEAVAFPFTGSLGSGAIGAGSETLRQGIGNLAGLENDAAQTAQDAALVGGVSATIPAVGKFLKPAIKGVANSGKGLVSKLTQATKGDVDTFVNRGDELDGILRSDTGFTDSFNDIITEVAAKEKQFKNEIGQQFAELRKQGIEVDISTAKKVYDDKIAELQSKVSRGSASDADIGLLESIQKERDNLFSRSNQMRDITSTNNEVTGEIVEDQNLMSQLGMQTPSSTVNQTGRRSVTDTFQAVDDGTTTGDLIAGGKLNTNPRTELADGQDISDAMDIRQRLANNANFKNRSDLSKSLDSSSVSENLAARGYGEIGQSIDNVAAEIGSKESRQQFKDHIEFVGDIAKHFKTPESVESFLKAADKGGRKTITEKLSRIDKRFGTDLTSKNQLVSTAQALKGQESGSLVDLVRPKSTLEFIGGAVGAKAAWASGQPWLIPVTLTAGAAIGRKMGSVSAARKYVDFIVDVESKALGYDKKAQELLKKQLYKSVTGESALRSAVKGSVQTRQSEE